MYWWRIRNSCITKKCRIKLKNYYVIIGVNFDWNENEQKTL